MGVVAEYSTLGSASRHGHPASLHDLRYVAVMARAADFDLAAELARPGFTPGARDAPALVELVVAGDDPAATRAATALAALGAAGRAAIDARFATADDGTQARLVRALGLLARAGDGGARAALLARITDGAPRVRKAAAVALGKLDGDDARQALIARWDAGNAATDERRALAEALGKLGGGDAIARLKALDAGGDAELARLRDRAVLMGERTAARSEASRIRDDVAPPEPITVQLGCRPGLGALLVDELAALGMAARPVGDRGAELRVAAPPAALFASRLWATLAIPFPLSPAEDLAAAVAQTLAAPAVLGLLRAWTQGPIRWRLGFTHGHKRAVIWRAAQAVGAAVPDLVNDPTATTWDALVDDTARTLALVPRRLDDPRFAYRVADVPAASHPTVAAALAWLAEARPTDRVWDPFCGSAVELIERAQRGPLRSLIGTDLDAAALDTARANLAAAGVSAELAIADARTHTPGPPGSIDLIITNPPLGSRVQLDAAALLVAALPNLARALAPGGRLVWITPAPRRTTPVAEQLGLVRRRSHPVDLGGVRGQLERWDRR
jgi:SAM-dependent methyltransferase